MIRTYQAIDSVTGGLYTWQSATIDHLGTGYTGPNSPTHILQISPEYWHGDTGAPGSAYTAGWKDLANIDFTALASLDITANGLLDLGDVNGYVYNYGSIAPTSALFGIVNGSGLRLSGVKTSVATNTEAGRLHTAGVRLFFPDLANYTNIHRNTKIRVVAEAGENYSSSSGSRQGFGIAVGDTTDALGTQATNYHIFGGTGGTTPRNRIDGIQGFGAKICGGDFTEVTGVTGFQYDNATLGLELESLCSVCTCRGLLGGVGIDCIADPDEAIPAYLSHTAELASGALALRARFVMADWAVHVFGFAEAQMTTAYSFVRKLRIQAWY